MKILHILTSINPKHGGTVEATKQMALTMQARGVEADVLTLVSPEKGWDENWPVPLKVLGGTFSRYCYTRALAPWLRENHTQYAAVIVHGVWRYPSWGAQRVLDGTGTPYFLFTHGMLDPWFEKAYPGKHLKKATWWRIREHRALRDARAVLFTSQAEMELSPKSFRPYQCRGVVTGLGVAPPPAPTPDQLTAFYARFPHLRSTRNVLFLGRIHKKKGCDLLIRAFGEAASQDPALRLVIAGDDEEGKRPDLEKIAFSLGVADRITWAGHLDGDAKWGAFRAAEVFVLPSHSENYGIALVEALACGVPVLITDKVNTWQEVADCRAGLVAEDTFEGALSLLRNWLALTTEEQERMRLNAFSCYQQRFEPDGFAERFIEFLKRELEPSAPASSRPAYQALGSPEIEGHRKASLPS
jgi:glycosyltransferase involved in cell wall biosynthesis